VRIKIAGINSGHFQISFQCSNLISQFSYLSGTQISFPGGVGKVKGCLGLGFSVTFFFVLSPQHADNEIIRNRTNKLTGFNFLKMAQVIG
jgi:hypothetical protein